MTSPIILASTSKYRRELLQRLAVKFQCEPPRIDESAEDGESPQQTCIRLAREKCMDIAKNHPDAIVIGSDQVADVEGEAISKPGTHEKARAQLRSMSGKTIIFHTAVCVANASSGKSIEFCVPTEVQFRDLSAAEIERYLIAEEPYDCAGAAKSEGLGIALLKRIESADPTALIGLPLIKTAEALREHGVVLP